MKAMLLDRLAHLREDEPPLRLADLPEPMPGEGEILIRITACGVCRTDLDEIEGRTAPPQLPVVLGHQVVGRVAALGQGASAFAIGDRVGVAWIHSADGDCAFCRSGRENLCPNFKATGRDVNGGYAEYMTVGEGFAHRLPDGLTDVEAAPLLCAGAVGYRALRLADLQDGECLGLTGFGASGHLVLQAARHCFPRSDVFVFARRAEEREHALALGAAWAGDMTDEPPTKLHAIIDSTPAWRPVVEALRHLEPGGRLVINAIRKEDVDRDALLHLDYASHLWLEKEVKSVANVTRADVREFLSLAAQAGIKPDVQVFPLEEANRALMELKVGKIRGAKVLTIG
ncbi:MAG: zinc-dependent alcohol dehydrogenase family protein [Candidatus Brachytrichaceae bacterium NZ_4S206]|jgi:propanol-preferring alcohol dehydrogenase